MCRGRGAANSRHGVGGGGGSREMEFHLCPGRNETSPKALLTRQREATVPLFVSGVRTWVVGQRAWGLAWVPELRGGTEPRAQLLGPRPARAASSSASDTRFGSSRPRRRPMTLRVGCHGPSGPFSRQAVPLVPANARRCSAARGARAPSPAGRQSEGNVPVWGHHARPLAHTPRTPDRGPTCPAAAVTTDARDCNRYCCARNRDSEIYTFTHEEELSISTELCCLRRIVIMRGRSPPLWERSLLCCRRLGLK